MASHRKISESETLMKYELSFENVKNQPIIAQQMADCGYDAVKIKEGKDLLAACQKEREVSQKEGGGATEAYNEYHKKETEIKELFKKHRKRGRVAFVKDPVAMKILGLSGNLPRAHAKWVDSMRIFYKGLKNKPELLAKVARFKITLAVVDANLALIDEMETRLAAYKKEKGESEDATSSKDMAFEKIDTWMTEFYANAKIALEDHPQLLEALGIVVRR